MKYLGLIVLLSATLSTGFTQNTIAVKGMEFKYEILEDKVKIVLAAPTKGWVGVGFNTQNSIVESDLYLFRVKDGRTEGLDMKVISFGNPQEDQVLGGTIDFSKLKGKEENGTTQITFQLPLNTRDQYDFDHQLNKPFWLILAYSTQDDFGHHSRVREHIKFTFEN